MDLMTIKYKLGLADRPKKKQFKHKLVITLKFYDGVNNRFMLTEEVSVSFDYDVDVTKEIPRYLKSYIAEIFKQELFHLKGSKNNEMITLRMRDVARIESDYQVMGKEPV